MSEKEHDNQSASNQEQLYQRRLERQVKNLIFRRFEKGDIYAVLDYAPQDQPKTYEEHLHNVSLYAKRLRRAIEGRGLKFPDYAYTAYMDEKTPPQAMLILHIPPEAEHEDIEHIIKEKWLMLPCARSVSVAIAEELEELSERFSKLARIGKTTGKKKYICAVRHKLERLEYEQKNHIQRIKQFRKIVHSIFTPNDVYAVMSYPPERAPEDQETLEHEIIKVIRNLKDRCKRKYGKAPGYIYSAYMDERTPPQAEILFHCIDDISPDYIRKTTAELWHDVINLDDMSDYLTITSYASAQSQAEEMVNRAYNSMDKHKQRYKRSRNIKR